MKLKNETEFDGRFLKTVITAVHRHIAKAERRKVPGWKALTVRVTYGKGWRCGGTVIKAPQRKHVTAGRLAEFTWHQIHHWYGYEHGSRLTRFGGKRMRNNWPSLTELADMLRPVGIKPGDPIPLKPSKTQLPKSDVREAVRRVRAERDKAEADLRRALEKRKEWTVKAKRAKTALGTWRSRELAARRKLERLNGEPDAIAQDVLGNYQPAMAGDIKV